MSGQNTFPIRFIKPLSYHLSGVNALQVVFALKKFTIVSKKISVLVEGVKFAKIEVDNLCRNN